MALVWPKTFISFYFAHCMCLNTFFCSFLYGALCPRSCQGSCATEMSIIIINSIPVLVLTMILQLNHQLQCNFCNLINSGRWSTKRNMIMWRWILSNFLWMIKQQQVYVYITTEGYIIINITDIFIPSSLASGLMLVLFIIIIINNATSGLRLV